ncbi:MAG: hypothetical protein LBL93_03435 [Ruminococcus sp.]|jgi:hypothetical protein|nr:hypothetical protein [Ruminococcus sp.]
MNIITVIGNGFQSPLTLITSDGSSSGVIKHLIEKMSSEDITNIIGSLVILLAAYLAYKSVNKQIRGDVVAKSRIEWIQEVRKLTADLISTYSELQLLIVKYRINNANVNDIVTKGTEILNKTQLLSLYFTAKPKQEISCENYNDYETNIYNKLINNKEPKKTNARIVKMLDYICSETIKYCSLEIDLIKSDFHSNPKNEQQKQEYKKRKKVIEGYTVQLREVMSLYLKIEWDKAKKGK